MNQNKLTFESGKLSVDFLAFQYQDLETFDKERILEYFLKLGFNARADYGTYKKYNFVTIKSEPANEYFITFKYLNLSPKSTVERGLIQFSGIHAAQFYKMAQQNLVDWKIFSGANLTRFDLQHSRYRCCSA